MSVFKSLGSLGLEGNGRLWARSAIITVGAALLVPLVLPVLTRGMRPLAKGVVKGGLLLTDKAKEVIAEAGEQWSDLVAEVRADINAQQAQTATVEGPSDGAEA